MKRLALLTFALLLLPLFTAADWLQFRGSDQTSLALESKLPLNYSPEKNLAWKSPLVGRGVSGPIVVGDRIYVTASSGSEKDKQDHLYVLAFDAKSGKQLWKRHFWATGRCFHHPTSANAAPTPASDGKRIFAFYSSNDLACLDLDGNLLWYRGLAQDYPKAGNDVGMSSSPVVVGETVVVQVENQGDSFAAGIDTSTGETRWRVNRPAEANWASPAALRGKDGKQLVLLQSAKGLTAHDPLSGEQKWKYDAGCNIIPSPTTVGSRIYLAANGLTVLEADTGATAANIAWDSNKLGPGNASPVIADGKVFALRGAVLTGGNDKTGEELWQVRLKGNFWATPVVASGHVYCVNQDGQCFVIKPGDEKGELVSTMELGDSILGSPAVAGDAMYLRSDKFLYKMVP
ncbi:MAG: PQQ-binding-like beta-propeller repeat protein [Planctomycetales bacterium]|nr:PQQ-binding-like beta-propeller repeat protein [Planctomycetales bacterium]